MTAKEWLRRGLDMEKTIAALEEAQERAYARATSATAAISPAPGGGGGKTDNRADAYIALGERIEREQERLALVHAEIIGATARIGDEILRALIIERYVNGHSWREVAERLRYNEDHVRGRLHARALRAVYAQGIVESVENLPHNTTK